MAIAALIIEIPTITAALFASIFVLKNASRTANRSNGPASPLIMSRITVPIWARGAAFVPKDLAD